MSSGKVTIVCKRVKFYSQLDDEMFFETLLRVSCIESFEGIGRELHLYISSPIVSRYDWLSLEGIFLRYKIKNIEQLNMLTIQDGIDKGNPDAE